MHIIYMVHDFPVNGLATGGAGNYVANMAQIMRQKGHRVGVITEAKKEACIEWNGIVIYYIEATKGFKDAGRQMTVAKKVLKNFCRSIYYNRKVKEIDKRDKVDVVQSVNTYGIALFRVKKIPYIIRLSSYPPLWGSAEREKFEFQNCLRTRRLDEELQLLALKRADQVISPSFLIAELVKKRIRKSIEVVESPVLVDVEKTSDTVDQFLEKDGYFVTFGANGNRKSIQMLAGVVDEILDLYPNMNYVIIGKDKLTRYRGDYEKSSVIYSTHVTKNRDRFFFMGEISDRKRLFSIVQNAKCCLLPTRVDNLPNTVLEAMALGKIVISSTDENGTSVEQLITDGENGFLAQVDDAKDMIKKINQVMNLSNEERTCIEKAAMARTAELTPECVYQKMIRIYEEIVRTRK